MQTLNTSKFQLALFSRNSVSQLSLFVRGVTLYSQELVKLLGVLIDRGLHFNEHVSKIAAQQLNSLSGLSSVLPMACKCCILYTFII